MGILNDSNHQQQEDFDSIQHQIRQIKMNKTDRWHNMAKINFLGIGDEPKKTFFVLVEAKQRMENMSLPLTEEDVFIKDEGEILREMENFYGVLCTPSGSTP